MSELNFNAREVEPKVGFELIPAGDYLAVIADSEDKFTKAGTGKYLALTFTIIDDACKGRLLWANLNLVNPNDQAVQIARAELSAICRAVRVLEPRDSTELHDIPLVISVSVRRNKTTGELENKIAGYKPRETQQPASPPAPNPAKGGAPWKRPSRPADDAIPF